MTRTSLLRAALLFVCGTLLALGLADPGKLTHRLTFRVQTEEPTRIQVFYDLGRGFNESDSAVLRLGATLTPRTLEFALPPSEIRAVRLDLTDGSTVVSFGDVMIVSPRGQRLMLASEGFGRSENIQQIVPAPDRLSRVIPEPGAEDPSLVYALPVPHRLSVSWADRVIGNLWFALGFGVAVAGVGALVAKAFAQQARLKVWCRSHPVSTLWMVSLISIAASSYPVVFLGRSYVSPNNGAALLYPTSPTVPDVADKQTADTRGSDVGAMMWAHLPYSTVQARAYLDHAELPLWNRYNSAGVTLLGQGQSMFGDPIHLLVVLARGASWAWDAKFLVAKLLFAAGLGISTWQISRQLGPAIIVSLISPFLSFFCFRFNHPAFFSVCYTPWIMTAWLSLSSAHDPRAIVARLLGLSIVNVTVLGSGTVKEAYLLMLSLNVVGLSAWIVSAFRSSTSSRPEVAWGGRWKAAGWIAGGVFCNVLLVTPLWLPFADTLRTARTTYDDPQVWQAPRAWLIGFFDDIFYRALNPWRNVYLPGVNLLFLPGIFFAFWEIRSLLRSSAALVIGTAWLASMALAFSFVPAGWIQAVPFLNQVYHIHNTFGVIAIVLGAMLAGWGYHAAALRVQTRSVSLPLAGFAIALLTLLFVYFRDIPSNWINETNVAGWWARVPEHAFFYINLALMLVSLPLALVVGFRAIRRGHWRRWERIALALAVVACVYRFSLHLPWPGMDQRLLSPGIRAPLDTPSESIAWLDNRNDGAPFRVVGLDNFAFPGFLSVYGLEGINGPDAIMSREYRELADASGMANPKDWRFFFTLNDLGAHARLLDLFGVRYALGSNGVPFERIGLTRETRLDLDIASRPSAWPRAFYVPSIETYGELPQLVDRIVRGPEGVFATVAERDRERLPTSLVGAPGTAHQPATEYRLTTNSTTFTVRSEAAGLAVLHETWHATDFRATLNGQAVPYLRVNHAFKGVVIPGPGTWTVSFTYWPRTLTLSLAIAAAGVAGFVVLWTLAKRSRRTLESTA